MNTSLIILLVIGFIANLFLAHLVGKNGANRQIGYTTAFLASFFFTPIIGLLLVLSSKELVNSHLSSPSKKDPKILLFLGGIVGLALILFLAYRSSYNSAIQYQENVEEKWGNVQSAYQRRADLVPNLVETVKGAAANEKEILTKVTQARAGIVGVADEISNAKNPQQLEMLGKKINTAINLAYEAYPQIRSTENFQGLQMQLEGTENRINRERDLYNEAIKEYNTHIRGFFNSMFLSSATFPKKEGFKASEGAENSPNVKF
jgi:LemA protein